MLDLGTCYVIWIIIIAIFLLGLPITNLVLSIKSLGKKPEASANIKLDELNAKALKSVTVKGNEIYLKRKEGIKKIWVDIVYFFGKKKKKVSYCINYEGNVAIIDAPVTFDSIAVYALKADAQNLHKKVVGYQNKIVHAITSIGLFIGYFVPSLFTALFYSQDLYSFTPTYGVFYIIPLVVGIVVALIHFFVGNKITNATKIGGKK